MQGKSPACPKKSAGRGTLMIRAFLVPSALRARQPSRGDPCHRPVASANPASGWVSRSCTAGSSRRFASSKRRFSCCRVTARPAPADPPLDRRTRPATRSHRRAVFRPTRSMSRCTTAAAAQLPRVRVNRKSDGERASTHRARKAAYRRSERVRCGVDGSPDRGNSLRLSRDGSGRPAGAALPEGGTRPPAFEPVVVEQVPAVGPLDRPEAGFVTGEGRGVAGVGR
jgi:hypothetical protein